MVILIFIPLMTNEINHLFTYNPLREVSVQNITHFLVLFVLSQTFSF